MTTKPSLTSDYRDNIYYFRWICAIGGIETFLYQLVKKFPTQITILCEGGNREQIERLSEYAEVIFYQKGKKYYCHNAFFNFNIDSIDDIVADLYTLVVHGNYKWLKSPAPVHNKINRVVAVSKDSAEAYTEITGIPCDTIYNPIEYYPKKTKLFMSATRVDISSEDIKGGRRMIALRKALDNYCKLNNCAYRWDVYSNNELPDEGFTKVKPSLDVTSFMNRYDYVIQLSDNFEGYNYTTNEALMIGVPCVLTPCDVYKELKVGDNAIYLDFDLSNIDEVCRRIFEDDVKPKYKPPESHWEKLIYKSEIKKEIPKLDRYRVKATENVLMGGGISIEEFGGKPSVGDETVVLGDRLISLTGNNPYGVAFVELIEKLPEENEKPAEIEEKQPLKSNRGRKSKK